jgi:DNA-binding PadR family transcriptional regulator
MFRLHIYGQGGRPAAGRNPNPPLAVIPMSTLEYHVLLALAGGPFHGYAVKQRVEEESAGSLTPQPGSLYRVIARLIGSGLVNETEPRLPAAPHPGLARRYYVLTAAGRRALAAEARRLKGAAALAEKRLRTARP